MTDSIRSDRQHLRKFGLVLAIGFIAVGSVSRLRHHTVAPMVLWALAVANGVPALVAPTLLGPVERVWMKLGNVMGWVNTRIILTVLFYVVVFPAGLLMRLFRDPLDRELYDTRSSYWHRRPARTFDPATYQRQF
jgi:hypothetical protein